MLYDLHRRTLAALVAARLYCIHTIWLCAVSTGFLISNPRPPTQEVPRNKVISGRCGNGRLPLSESALGDLVAALLYI